MKISTSSIETAMLKKQIMTFSALANSAGISRQCLSTIKGRGTCTPKTLAKLATALEVDPAELLDINQK